MESKYQLGFEQYPDVGPGTMAKLDELCAGPGPTPPSPPGPGPAPPAPPARDNEELETTLNRISVAYQLMITRERDGVSAVCRDLSNLDTPESSMPVPIQVLLETLTTGLYGFGETALRVTIKKFIHGSSDDSDPTVNDLDGANDKVFDGIFNKVHDALFGPNKPDESRADKLADYCDAQLDNVTRAGFGEADAFERDVKPILRRDRSRKGPSKTDPRNHSGDPRVDAALILLDGTNKAALDAFQKYYDQALHAWSSKLAQSVVGVDEDNLNDTNLEPLKGSKHVPAGILQIVFFPELDASGEQVHGARIDGLSRRVRGKLEGKSGAQVGLPIIADGPLAASRIRIGITESHRVLDLTDSPFPHITPESWLTKRGGGDRRQGVLRVADTVLNSKVPNVDTA